LYYLLNFLNKKKKLTDIGFADDFHWIWKFLVWTVFPLAGSWILDAANLVNQLETKLYPQTNVDKSNNSFFQNAGFYCFSRRLPIMMMGCITKK